MFVDADTHVDECEETWSYIPKSMEHIRPGTMTFLEGQAPSYLSPSAQRVWFIDGRVHQRRIRSDEHTGTTVDKRELRDIPGRLRDMDAYGVDVQVIYPTIFLSELTQRPDVDRALCESWNRWMADRCSESNGRLRFVALAPMNSIPDAVTELRRAREDGAIGVFKRGVECTELQIADPYFDPIYDVAQDLDMPICIHSSSPYSHRDQSLMCTTYAGRFYTVQNAFFQIVSSNMAKRYPRLKIGFIEAGATWLSGLLWLKSATKTLDSTMDSKMDFLSEPAREARREADRDLLSESRLFVTCEPSEYVNDLVHEVGSTNLMVGSDYCHSDHAAILRAHSVISEERALTADAADRLTNLNAREFYGL